MKKKFLYIFWGMFLIFFLNSCSLDFKKKDKKNYSTSNDFTVEEILVNGQRQYHLRGCIKCHGRTGKGDGYRTLDLPKKLAPRNFKDLAGYKQGSNLDSIAFTIKNGITNLPPVRRRGLLKLFSSIFSTNLSPSSAMPAYSSLSSEEINHIAYYVLYLQTNQDRPIENKK